ncbi:MAG: hypothetical protein L6Q72_04930 [Burkholderiaceae bacterium]|nr:hypothetical protein [Burkholderiaceae bacterium]GIL03588.1 MAG: hypothetical protein BroJett031_01080 [Betaproteobacteria bacterium]
MRRVVWIALFWTLLLGLVALDYVKARAPHDRFAEPPPWALGHEASGRGGHCSSAPR